ncbi:hypothetical protein B0T25DRAFT_536689 [Lasiosphaeria hispida]|uniref:Zn(2)-C6 fungal-type domain-containing protein n=1 Tax=Lasiosphaeria hispida TaxID=260671 RepID=A0AAJ0HK53_9PEZI|nr:hypothetical protein B0T25DRAFT_536689 [Lasiosphaeria hispida]
MFITLKSSSGYSNGGGGGSDGDIGAMEQVSLSSASQAAGTDRVRGYRKPACIACQSKKLRCTGSTRNCDRCKVRSIACVFPPNNRLSGPRNSRPLSLSTDTPGFVWQKDGASGGGACPESGDHSLEGVGDETRLPTSPPTQNATVCAPSRGPMVEDDFLEGDWWNYLDDMGQDNFPLGDGDMVVPANGARSEGFPPGVSQHVLGMQRHLQNLPITTAHDLPGLFSLDESQVAADRNRTQSTMQTLILGESAPMQSRSNSCQCTCLHDTVRVVQQLDDDEFHITTLPLDQVLQLLKWLIFQCCKPLSCPGCVGLSAVHTVLLIVCDRLTEMFECIHKRIRRANASLADQSSSDGDQTPGGASSGDSARASNPTAAGGVGDAMAAQLFCSASGQAQAKTSCNPMMFSDTFRSQYSDEEQVHMIRVLLKLQIRNFRQLLLRVESTCQLQGSQARKSKVKSFILRLAKAAAAIDEAMHVVSQLLAVP